MANLLLVSLAPVAIILGYIYIRDKYDREPIGLLLKTLVAGALITIPIILLESLLQRFTPDASLGSRISAAYTAFVVAAFSEELLKFAALFLIIWNNRNFNEKFDGIVYSVFISLGFAAVENLMYVFGNGFNVGLMRAFLAIPGHAFFGVAMGYYLAFARFGLFYKKRNLFFALAVPIFLHGTYDFILMANEPLGLFVFVPFIIYLWKSGFKRINELSKTKRFKIN